jgi:chemotaxis receptor (MCP) glutamine deamidase CheD
MQGQGVLVRAARLGSSAVARLCQPAPSVTGIRHMVLYDERERGEEV